MIKEPQNSHTIKLTWAKLLCKVCVLVGQSYQTLCHPMDCPTRFLCPWDFPGKNSGVGGHSLFQGIFPTQESNLGLFNCRQILYPLSHAVNGFKWFKIRDPI